MTDDDFEEYRQRFVDSDTTGHIRFQNCDIVVPCRYEWVRNVMGEAIHKVDRKEVAIVIDANVISISVDRLAIPSIKVMNKSQVGYIYFYSLVKIC